MSHKAIVIWFSILMLAVVNVDSSYALLSIDDWVEKYNQVWAEEESKSLARSLSSDSWDLYKLSYAIDGNVAMFQATENPLYLDRAIELVMNCIKSSELSSSIKTSQFKDKYKTWTNRSHPHLGNDGKEYPLFESYCWRYVTRLLNVMKMNNKIMGREHYQNMYHEILDFTEINIFEKWYSRGVHKHIYRSRTHMASHWAYIALHLKELGKNDKMLQVYEETVGSVCKGLPNYPSSLSEQLIPNPTRKDAYFWDSKWGSFDFPGQDVSHGNNVVSFIVEAYSLGYLWSLKDIEMLCNTFSKVIWPDKEKYAKYVDGSGEGNGWFTDGFCKLGRFNFEIQKRLENHTVGISTQFIGNAALNVKILMRNKEEIH